MHSARCLVPGAILGGCGCRGARRAGLRAAHCPARLVFGGAVVSSSPLVRSGSSSLFEAREARRQLFQPVSTSMPAAPSLYA
jgi:hypothetical protein